MTDFEKFFSRNENFEFEDGIYCQSGLDRHEFEKEYTGIREKEGRMYDDEVVRNLPDVPRSHPLYNEWKVRSYSANHLVSYLRSNKCNSIVEIGCGNGWLVNYIQRALQIPACGIDIEKEELHQAVRVSHGASVFTYADIFSKALDGLQADVVLLASCIQYFPDVKSLIRRLRKIGTVHILDSPIYDNGTAGDAKVRSAAYFKSMGSPGMEKFYYHHELREFVEFAPEYVYNPSDVYWRIIRAFMAFSPFLWIKIDKST